MADPEEIVRASIRHDDAPRADQQSKGIALDRTSIGVVARLVRGEIRDGAGAPAPRDPHEVAEERPFRSPLLSGLGGTSQTDGRVDPAVALHSNVVRPEGKRAVRESDGRQANQSSEGSFSNPGHGAGSSHAHRAQGSRSARAGAALAGLGDEEPASPDPDQASRAVQVGRDDRHGGSCCIRRRGGDRRQRQNACREDDEEPSSKHVLPPHLAKLTNLGQESPEGQRNVRLPHPKRSVVGRRADEGQWPPVDGTPAACYARRLRD